MFMPISKYYFKTTHSVRTKDEIVSKNHRSYLQQAIRMYLFQIEEVLHKCFCAS